MSLPCVLLIASLPQCLCGAFFLTLPQHSSYLSLHLCGVIMEIFLCFYKVWIFGTRAHGLHQTVSTRLEFLLGLGFCKVSMNNVHHRFDYLPKLCVLNPY